jgi:hypothetical protein
MARCQAIKADGERCKGEASPGAEWCYSHDPAHAEERRRNASRGGKAGGRGRPGADLADLKREVRAVIGGVLTGRIAQGPGAVALQGFNTLLRAAKVEMDMREQQELIERIEALERGLEQRGDGSWQRRA